jgi:hypothetical protein
MIEVTMLRAAFRSFASSIGLVASLIFMETTFIASFVSNALEYFDHTGSRFASTCQGFHLGISELLEYTSGTWLQPGPEAAFFTAASGRRGRNI